MNIPSTDYRYTSNTKYLIFYMWQKNSFSKRVRHEWVPCIFSSHCTNSLRSWLPDDKVISVLRCHRNFILRFHREREIRRKWEARGHALAFCHHMNSAADTIWSHIFPFMLFINIIPLLKSDLSHIHQVDFFHTFPKWGVPIYRSYFPNNIFYEITNRCSYMQSILFHC